MLSGKGGNTAKVHNACISHKMALHCISHNIDRAFHRHEIAKEQIELLLTSDSLGVVLADTDSRKVGIFQNLL